MPGCVLRISGATRRVRAAAESAPFPFAEAIGSARARERGASADATFNLTVSDAPGSEVPRQIAEAEAFVRAHHAALRDLLAADGVSHGVLDFGCELPAGSAGTWFRWPLSLIKACAEVGLELEVSTYLAAGGSE